MTAICAVLILLVWPSDLIAAPASGDHAMLEQRARQAVEVLQARREPGEVFNRHFLTAVPPQRLRALAKSLEADNGPIVAAEDIEPEGAQSAVFRVRFARAIASARITLERTAPFKVSGFRVGAAMPIGDTREKILADFAALRGRAGFAAARLGDGEPVPVLAHRADEQFAIGSTFKLWVLDVLAEEVAAGRLRWDQVVPLGPRSLPGGITQAWPEGAPVTIETLATLMISISDNTATDTLIGLIGREAIAERVRATGHSAPARTLPLLTTAEAFALKLGPAQRRAAYAKADEAGQESILAAMDAAQEIAAAQPGTTDGAPVAIDSAEWFASPGDIVRLLDALRRREGPRILAILGVSPHLDDTQRRAFAYAGYKGGSESGVLNLTWLLCDKAGTWFAVTASWNDPQEALDEARLEAIGARLIRLLQSPG